MKYEMSVHIYLRQELSSGPGLELREMNMVELSTLSDAAEILVKLHEFFETVRKKGGK